MLFYKFIVPCTDPPSFYSQFLESFATKQISSSEDRLEETKRRKLAIKAQKLVELMMVSGIGTSSGFEERIRFSEIEIVDSNAIDTGVMHTIPEGNYINGWDVNVAGVRVVSQKRNIRQHKHSEFLRRIKRKGELEHFVARRYGDFARLHKALRTELPGRVLPALPKKNKSDSTAPGIFSVFGGGDNSDDASTISTVSTRLTGLSVDPSNGNGGNGNGNGNSSGNGNGAGSLLQPSSRHRHTGSSSARSIRSTLSNNGRSPRTSADGRLLPSAGKEDKETNVCKLLCIH